MAQKIQIVDASGNPINSGNPLSVNATVTANPPSAVVSTNNSTTALLTANSVFTGTSESALAYGSISVEVFADQASAASGLSIQQSQDGTNWDTRNAFSVVASTAFQTTVNLVGQFFRVIYTNGSVNQGAFRLQTIKLPAPSPAAGVSNQRVSAQSSDFATGSIVDLATLLTQFAELLTDTDNLAGLATQTTLAAILAKIVAAPALEGGNLATLVTNTADLLADGDNLATIATNTTGASTAANQATSNTSLSSIVTNTNKLIAPSVNVGTIDATTQRTVAGGAATGTKTNVASSASSVTILASNTSRKGAMIYNDSTALLYLDLSGGTASSTSYSVQMPANSFFELPGPNLYNGAITGIWAAANGNARVTEWS